MVLRYISTQNVIFNSGINNAVNISNLFVKQNVQPSFQTKYLVKTNESGVTYAMSQFINKVALFIN